METKKLTKVCLRCKKEKPIEEFNKCSSTKDGYQNACRECQKYYYSTYHSKKKEEVNEPIEKVVSDMFDNSSLVALPKSLSIPMRAPVEPAPLPKPKTSAEILKEISTPELMKVLRSRKDFSIKDSFTPRELMETLYSYGYRGTLDIMVKQTVTLSPHE